MPRTSRSTSLTASRARKESSPAKPNGLAIRERPANAGLRELVWVEAGSLQNNPLNWRKHPPHQVKALAASIKANGWAGVLMFNETTGHLLDGHARKDLDPKSIVPVGLGNWTPEQERNILATLDPIGSMAEADTAMLKKLSEECLADLAKLPVEEQVQFEDLLTSLPDFQQRVASAFDPSHSIYNQRLTAGKTDPDLIPEPPDEAQTKPGDLILLGRHRLLCGDAGDPAAYSRLLKDSGGKVQLVITDPPYNVDNQPRSVNAIAAGQSNSWSSKQAFRRTTSSKTLDQSGQKLRVKDRLLPNDKLDDESYNQLVSTWFARLAERLEPGRAFYIWGGYSNCRVYPDILDAVGMKFAQPIIWIKEHPVINRRDFMGNHEWCFYGWREGKAHVFLGPSNVTDTWSVKKVAPQQMVHLTEKPVELFLRAISYSSRKDEAVLDPFAGSGSCLIACEQTGRVGRLMEIDPLYCDVIIERWEKFTGQQAIREGWGNRNGNGKAGRPHHPRPDRKPSKI